MSFLAARAREKDWAVTLKALGVVHRLMREGHVRILAACGALPMFGGMEGYLDERSTNAWGQSRFIREYGQYLEEKARVFKTIGRSVELLPAKDGGEWVRSLPFNKLKDVLPKLQVQFDKLLKCDPYTDEGGVHEVAILALLQLIKDGFRIYSVLTISVFQQLNRWKKMSNKEGLFFLSVYELFVKETKLFKAWALKMVKSGLVDKEVLPDFDNLPENLISTLENYFQRDNDEQEEGDLEEEEVETPKQSVQSEATEEEEIGALQDIGTRYPNRQEAGADEDDDEEEVVVPEKKRNIINKSAATKSATTSRTVVDNDEKVVAKVSKKPAIKAAVANKNAVEEEEVEIIVSKKPAAKPATAKKIVEVNEKVEIKPVKKAGVSKKVVIEDEDEVYTKPAKKPAKKSVSDDDDDLPVQRTAAPGKKIVAAPQTAPVQKKVAKVIQVNDDSEIVVTKAAAKAVAVKKVETPIFDIDELYGGSPKKAPIYDDPDAPFEKRIFFYVFFLNLASKTAPKNVPKSSKPSKKVIQETPLDDDLDLL